MSVGSILLTLLPIGLAMLVVLRMESLAGTIVLLWILGLGVFLGWMLIAAGWGAAVTVLAVYVLFTFGPTLMDRLVTGGWHRLQVAFGRTRRVPVAATLARQAHEDRLDRLTYLLIISLGAIAGALLAWFRGAVT